MAKTDVTISLSRDQALVLFEWLAREGKAETIPVAHPSEQRVLWELQAVLEKALPEPFASNYDEILAAARARLTDAAG